MKITRLALALVVLCLLVTSMALAQGNAYGHYKHNNVDPASTDPLAVNWLCETDWDSQTGVATIAFTIDNLAELIAANELVTANWTNITVDATEEIVIDSLSLGLEGDPAINLNFGVSGGKNGATFHIVAPLLTFPTLVNAQAVASATVTVTDYQLLRNGATANGLIGSKYYEARYNTSTVLYDLVQGPITVLATDPASYSAPPDNGPVQAIGTVSSMQSEWWFNITARDNVSGTSSYAIVGDPVPEPSTLLALFGGLVGVAGIARRRR